MEKEKDGKLPFLDLVIQREEEQITFDIYRKPTNNHQYIHAESNHPINQKLTAFSTAVHRLTSIPLSKINFEKEKTLLQSIASVNGFKPEIIENIIRKKNKISDQTNLKPINLDKKYVILPFNSNLCKGLKSIFKKENIDLVYKPNNTLRKLLGTSKDRIEVNKKSGIYLWTCENCEKGYVGQTRRNLDVRWKEHRSNYDKDTTGLSAIADHAMEEGHHCSQSGLTLIKEINNNKLLNAYESLYIHKIKNGKYKTNIRETLNANNGPINFSPLFDLL